MASNTVVLYLTHVYDETIAGEYERLKRECEPACDARLPYDASSRRTRRGMASPPCTKVVSPGYTGGYGRLTTGLT